MSIAASGGPARIADAFGAAAADGRTALVAYLLAGFPSEADALRAAEGALDAGADLLEVGVPFSDPVADGPTIAEAGRAALAAGGGLGGALRLVAALRSGGRDQPVLVMTYLNPLLAAGVEKTLRAIRVAGADGLIVPDLPAGADPRLERLAAAEGLGTAFLVAPNTPDERLEAAAGCSTAFLYVVPLLGVTGARNELAAGAAELLGRARAAARGRLPVAAGFGLKTADQVAAMAPHADGLVVGSALVDALRDGGPSAVRSLVGSLAAATSRPVGRGGDRPVGNLSA